MAVGATQGGRVALAGGVTKLVSASKTRPANTTQYASGDVINESDTAGTGWTFSSVARTTGSSGVIARAQIIDSANQATTLSCELWLFTASPAADNDNAAFTPTDAELADLVGIIPISTARVGDATSGAGGNLVLDSGEIAVPFVCEASATALYGVLVARNTYTPVSGESFTVVLSIYQD